MLRKVWISPEILDWYRFPVHSSLPLYELVKRPYEYVSHAEMLLEDSLSDFTRSDAVANLKRGLDHRLRSLEKEYRISRLPLPGSPKRVLQKLQLLGLVRPLLLNQLLAVRNAIEHQGRRAPPLKKCEELLDVVWYFLRSTDILVQVPLRELEYIKVEDGTETYYGFDLHIQNRGSVPRLTITGWFPHEVIRERPVAGFLALFATKMQGPERWRGTDNHKEKLDTDRWIIARLLPAPEEYVRIYRALFNAI